MFENRTKTNDQKTEQKNRVSNWIAKKIIRNGEEKCPKEQLFDIRAEGKQIVNA